MRQLQRKQVALAMAGVLFCLSSISIGGHGAPHTAVPAEGQMAAAVNGGALSQEQETDPISNAVLLVTHRAQRLSAEIYHPVFHALREWLAK